MERYRYKSPIGPLLLTATSQGINRLEFLEEDDPRIDEKFPEPKNRHLKQVIEQLDAYFAKKLTTFSCPIDATGTDFQQQVWQALTHISFGSTSSYGAVATTIGRSKASRAVGGANNRNPVPVIVPCHRVIGSDRKLVGYAGQLWRKRWLLEHEGIALKSPSTSTTIKSSKFSL